MSLLNNVAEGLSGALYSDISEVDPISYRALKNELYEWRRSGGRESRFNDLDQPGHLFFKIVFHLWNGDSMNMADSITNHNGLLTPAWLMSKGTDVGGASTGNRPNPSNNTVAQDAKKMAQNLDKITEGQEKTVDFDPTKFLTNEQLQNCAYNFLLRNDELERADKLRQFVELLSNISTYSPWYFIEVGGLDALLERPFKHDEAYVVEAPKQITIKCLPDSEDNRIATLLDLYRDVVYSYVWHKEILPANLRKFDMSIYIYGSPIKNLHSKKGKYGATMKMVGNESDDKWFTSFKRIELHNCEIDYNSSKTGYTGLNNTEGFGQEFTITISVGDAFESRYNTYMDRMIGDMVAIDMVRNSYTGGVDHIFTDAPQQDDESHMKRLKKLLYPGPSIDLFRVADDLTGNKVSNFIGSQILGNIYKTSISDMVMNARRFGQALKTGNVGGMVSAVDNMAEVKNGWYTRSMGNINDANKVFGRTKNI